MTTSTKINGQTEEKITALYCRLSVDDDNTDEESNSITNQKQILQDFAKKEGYANTMFFVDDGVSGTTFQRPNFMRMERMAENGEIGTIIVKDLSRFGREQVEMGRLTQVVYPSLGIRFVAHTGACRHADRRRRGDDALPQYFQRMVCVADLQENPCGVAVQSGTRWAYRFYRTLWLQEIGR